MNSARGVFRRRISAVISIVLASLAQPGCNKNTGRSDEATAVTAESKTSGQMPPTVENPPSEIQGPMPAAEQSASPPAQPDQNKVESGKESASSEKREEPAPESTTDRAKDLGRQVDAILCSLSAKSVEVGGSRASDATLLMISYDIFGKRLLRQLIALILLPFLTLFSFVYMRKNCLHRPILEREDGDGSKRYQLFEPAKEVVGGWFGVTLVLLVGWAVFALV